MFEDHSGEVLLDDELSRLLTFPNVTLNGYATNYAEKWNALKAAKRVSGVKAIADDIEVKFADSLPRNDGDIAGAAANQIGWSTIIP